MAKCAPYFLIFSNKISDGCIFRLDENDNQIFFKNMIFSGVRVIIQTKGKQLWQRWMSVQPSPDMRKKRRNLSRELWTEERAEMVKTTVEFDVRPDLAEKQDP